MKKGIRLGAHAANTQAPEPDPVAAWPAGLDETPRRLRIFTRLLRAKPGLTRPELAKHLRCSEPHAWQVAKRFGYVLKLDFPRRKDLYADVDWTLTDAEIARRIGRRRQAVSATRRRLKKGVSRWGQPHKGHYMGEAAGRLELQ